MGCFPVRPIETKTNKYKPKSEFAFLHGGYNSVVEAVKSNLFYLYFE